MVSHSANGGFGASCYPPVIHIGHLFHHCCLRSASPFSTRCYALLYSMKDSRVAQEYLFWKRALDFLVLTSLNNLVFLSIPCANLLANQNNKAKNYIAKRHLPTAGISLRLPCRGPPAAPAQTFGTCTQWPPIMGAFLAWVVSKLPFLMLFESAASDSE